jgi:hypothetical protein
MAIVILSVITLLLFAIATFGTGWYHYDPVIDPDEYDPFFISTHFKFGLMRADGYFHVYDEDFNLDYDLSFEYEEDYSETDERYEFHDIADNTLSVIGLAAIPLILFVLLAWSTPNLRRKNKLSILRYITPLLGLVAAILILLALSYLSTRFPDAVDSALQEMEEITEVKTNLGGSFYAMGAVAVMLIILSLAFVIDDRRWMKRRTALQAGTPSLSDAIGQEGLLNPRP